MTVLANYSISLEDLEKAKHNLTRTERETLNALLTPALLARIQYKYDPCAFAHDCIKWREGEGPSPYQEEILSELISRGRVAVRGPHGLGKTALASWVVLWAVLTSDDCKVPTTASAWRQLTYYLWPEIHKWAARLDWGKLHRPPFDRKTELLKLSLQAGPNSAAFAVACENSATIEGAHGQRVCYVYDEAKTIPDATWDASEGAFATAGTDTDDEAYALAISTPGEPVGRFHDIHSRRPGYEDWWTRHVTKDEAIKAGRMSAQWAEQRRKQWGEGSPLYQNRVEGEFAEQLSDSVIPLAYVEAAQERWKTWAAGHFQGTFTGLGVDVGGGSGGDPSVIARCYDRRRIRSLELRPFEKDPNTATMSLTGRVKGILDKHGGYAVVDGIGLGAGVVHRGREQGSDFRSFIASGGNDLTDQTGEIHFANNRAAMWWLARDLLSDPNSQACLPPDDIADPSGEMSLVGELTAPKWRELSNGRIIVESKEDIRGRLGRSTNLADACLQILTGPRVIGAFNAPSIANLSTLMAEVREELMSEDNPFIEATRLSRVASAVIGTEPTTPANVPQTTLHYIGSQPNLTLFLDGKPFTINPGWTHTVDSSLAKEVTTGLPHLFKVTTPEDE